MKMSTIRLETHIHAPAERCFDLSLDVDLHQNSVAHTKERAIAGVTSGVMGLNDTVTWEAIHFGMKQHLTTKITEYERPNRFVDEMVKGAFREIHHIHEFIPEADGTRMIDVFTFRAPLGPLGRLVEILVLERYMRGLLVTRNSHIKKAAEEEHRLLEMREPE